MQVFLAAFLATIAFSYAIQIENLDYENMFTNWMIQYDKVYSSSDFQKRYTIWRQNKKFVDTHNAKKLSYTVAMNEYADLSNEEFRAIYLGFKGSEELTQENVADLSNIDIASLPETVDWRTKGAVTGVKNQGQCGSCWSFSTTGNIEAVHYLTGNELVGLSEQNIMDCSWKYGNEGCDGGLMDNAFKYVIANKGVDTESSYPYTAESSKTCKYNPANNAANITQYTDVTSGSEPDLLKACASFEPISVAIDASETSFQLYDGGVYYSYLCGNKPSDLDHGVLVVGYGVYEGTKYWLVKNSWGSSWGIQNGYIMMIRDWDNNCGIATSASYSQFNGLPNTPY